MTEIKQWLASFDEEWLTLVSEQWIWILQVFAIILATVFANFFAKRFVRKLLHRLHKTETNWDNILLQAISRPLTWIIWLTGLALASHVIYRETGSPIFVATDLVRDIGVFVCLTWFVLAFVSGAVIS